MVIMSHGDFVTKILMTSANIKGFFQLLFSNASDDLIAAAYAWDSSDEVELDEPFVQGLVAAFLVAETVDQAAVDRMNAEIAKQVLALKVYTPQELRDLILADPTLETLVISGDDLLIANELNSRGINVNHLQVAYALRGV